MFRLLGGRVREIDGTDDMSAIGEELLTGAVRLIVSTEQVETIEDLMRRRLDLDYLPDQGVSLLSEVIEAFVKFHGGSVTQEMVDSYRLRVNRMRQRLGIALI